jgi:hypothetical protein
LSALTARHPLVNIPIALYPATRKEGLRFRLLRAKDLSPVNYKRVAEADGKEVPWDEIVKGYEYEKGKFVVLIWKRRRRWTYRILSILMKTIRCEKNDKTRMTNDERNPNARMTRNETRSFFRHSDLVIPSSLHVRHFSRHTRLA